jgi:hypothetical protein
MIELIIYGTCRHGIVHEQHHLINTFVEQIPAVIAHYRECNPQCIHVSVDIAFPDPDFMRTKQ